MIPVTKPFLPPIELYQAEVQKIWDRQWLTNNGPLVQEFEEQLREFLNLEELLFVTNGTIAIQLAIRALNLKGEIITTPFSYVATTSSIVWEHCKPIFVDIDEHTLNINPKLIESAITSSTSAILATHCFGNACDIAAIQQIAEKNDLKVIYDAAHCFGTRYNGQSIFGFGDISTTSFHATKLMHSIEGGAVFSKDDQLIERLKKMRNFGHNGPEKFTGVGINGKNSEFHAAMGLCVLQSVNKILMERKNQSDYYDQLLISLQIRKQVITPGCDYNFAYYPIIFPNEERALHAKDNLERNDIYPRRYFYPSLSTLDYVANSIMNISDQVAGSILCLPLYSGLQREDQELIAQVLYQSEKYFK